MSVPMSDEELGNDSSEVMKTQGPHLRKMAVIVSVCTALVLTVVALLQGKPQTFQAASTTLQVVEVADMLEAFETKPFKNTIKIGKFAEWATVPGVKMVRGDFNGDGATDIALVGGSYFRSIPVFTSKGPFYAVTNCELKNRPEFVQWAGGADVKVLVTDVDGDRKDDIVLIGGVGWNTVPVAFSDSNGCFSRVTNHHVHAFPDWARKSGVQAVAGDLNGDGKGDIALAGHPGWTILPTAYSHGDGHWTVVNRH